MRFVGWESLPDRINLSQTHKITRFWTRLRMSTRMRGGVSCLFCSRARDLQTDRPPSRKRTAHLRVFECSRWPPTTVQPRLPGASSANAICADLTPFPMVVSRLMIRMAMEWSQYRLAPKCETQCRMSNPRPWALQPRQTGSPNQVGGAPSALHRFPITVRPLHSSDGRHFVSARCCIA